MAASSSAAVANTPTSASTTLRCVMDSAIARSSERGLATATPGSMRATSARTVATRLIGSSGVWTITEIWPGLNALGT